MKNIKGLFEALVRLVNYVHSHGGKNPYSIPEYKQALIAIGKATDQPVDAYKWMDINFRKYLMRSTITNCCPNCGHGIASSEEEPDPEDYVMYDARGKTGVSLHESRHLGELKDDDEAEEFIREYARKHNWYADVWMLSDHGNFHLVKDFWKN